MSDELAWSLQLNPAQIDRSITRSQWREIHRWLRTVTRLIEAELISSAPKAN